VSGQTERIMPKDRTYLTELATAVHGPFARNPAHEAQPFFPSQYLHLARCLYLGFDAH